MTFPDYLLSAVATSTAQATVQPTIGLLPIPRNPIISTCAGTDEEPANCASECIRPIVSVIPPDLQTNLQPYLFNRVNIIALYPKTNSLSINKRTVNL